MGYCIIMSSSDNVATVLDNISSGEELVILNRDMKHSGSVHSLHEIPFGHKISLKDIETDANIIKYGEIIGRSVEKIKTGGYVHIHNVVSIEGSKKVVR